MNDFGSCRDEGRGEGARREASTHWLIPFLFGFQFPAWIGAIKLCLLLKIVRLFIFTGQGILKDFCFIKAFIRQEANKGACFTSNSNNRRKKYEYEPPTLAEALIKCFVWLVLSQVLQVETAQTLLVAHLYTDGTSFWPFSTSFQSTTCDRRCKKEWKLRNQACLL